MSCRRLALVGSGIGKLDKFRELFVYEEHYGAGEDKGLKAFLGRRCLVGSRAIVRRLDEVIAAELASGSVSMRSGLAHDGRESGIFGAAPCRGDRW